MASATHVRRSRLTLRADSEYRGPGPLPRPPVGLPAKRDAAHLGRAGEPECPGYLVQRQAVSEHVVIDEHALPVDILVTGDSQGVAQWALGDAAALLVAVPHHRRRWPGLHDERLARDVERPDRARRHLGRRPRQDHPRVVEIAPARPDVGWARGDDVELAKEIGLLLEEAGHHPAEDEGPRPFPLVLVAIDSRLQLS